MFIEKSCNSDDAVTEPIDRDSCKCSSDLRNGRIL
jgi:hypothetical protein